jgi:hypothetical protein
MKREDQQDATIRCLLLTSVSACFGHHYAHLQENKGPVTAFSVLFFKLVGGSQIRGSTGSRYELHIFQL